MSRGPSVEVTTRVGDPVDVDGWVDRYVATLLSLEGLRSDDGSPTDGPSRIVGPIRREAKTCQK